MMICIYRTLLSYYWTMTVHEHSHHNHYTLVLVIKIYKTRFIKNQKTSLHFIWIVVAFCIRYSSSYCGSMAWNDYHRSLHLYMINMLNLNINLLVICSFLSNYYAIIIEIAKNHNNHRWKIYIKYIKKKGQLKWDRSVSLLNCSNNCWCNTHVDSLNVHTK